MIQRSTILRSLILCALVLLSVRANATEQGVQSSGKPSRLNKVIRLLEEQRPAFGIFASDISARRAAALSSSSIDFVIVDMEHSPFDVTRLEGYLLAMIDKQRILTKQSLEPDVVPLIRLPSNARERLQYLMKQVLDLGVFGVVVPHVETAEDAITAVRAMRYPQRKDLPDSEPRGQRGVGYGWASRYWGLPGELYASKADLWPLDPQGDLLLWCMVESREGVENCRAIASTPGVSGIFIGPSDLAFSLGVAESDPQVEATIQRVLSVCKESGVACGTVASATQVEARLQQGFRFLAVGGDTGLPASVERAVEIGRRSNRVR